MKIDPILSEELSDIGEIRVISKGTTLLDEGEVSTHAYLLDIARASL